MKPHKYAIYQIGHAFFGIGSTVTRALSDANQWTDQKIRLRDLRDDDTADGEFCLVRITDALAARISKHGGAIASQRLGYIKGRPLYGTPTEAKA